MTIEIIKEKPISLTQAEYERMLREYNSCMAYTTAHVSFEVWARSRKQQEELAAKATHP